MAETSRRVLVHLASGIGNIVLATPLLVALDRMGFAVEVMLDADYAQTADLLREWSVVHAIHLKASRAGGAGRDRYAFIIPAVPPFYWPRFARLYNGVDRVVRRPADSLFYEDEQGYYMSFAHALGYPSDEPPCYRLPISTSDRFGVTGATLVLAPGCKTGEMALKRWPYFADLAERFPDVAVVGTSDDLWRADGTEFRFPPHARLLIDTLTLRETAEALAAAGVVVGNDSGLSHVAAAVGAPVLMLFGPTPHLTLGRLPSNVRVLRSNLACEPCWFGKRFQACESRIDCLRGLSVDSVAEEVQRLLG